jgi:hypothetical protein
MSETIDWGKASEYCRVLEEYAEVAKRKAKLFDPKKLVEDSRTVRKVYDPELGLITYRTLTLDDLVEINKQETNEEKNIVSLYLMLHKTYPDVTVDDVREFGLDAVVRLLKIIVGPTGFLQVPKTSEHGSNQTSIFRG